MEKRFIAFAVLIGLLMTPPVLGEPQQKTVTVSVDVTEAYLEDVLKVLSKQSGLNFVAAEEARDKKVTMYLDNVPVEYAIETLLRANRLELKPIQGNNLFVVLPSQAPKYTTVTKIIHLQYARVVPTAGDIFPVFGLTGSLITETFSSSSSSSGTSGSGGFGGTGGGGGGIGGLGGFGGGGLGGGFGGGGMGGGIGGAGGSSNQQQGTGQGLMQIIRSLLTEHGSAIPDPRTNSIIVTDIPERVEMIEQTLRKLDVKSTQIFIEAEVLEVNLDTLRRLGLEYGNSTGQIATYTGPSGSTFFPIPRGLLNAKSTPAGTAGTVSLFSSSANVILQMLATDTNTRLLARPRLLTLNNEVTEIRIVTDAVIGTTSSSQTQTGTLTTAAERTTVGTILRVTPMVNDNKYVTMVIEPEVSRVASSATFTSFLDPTRRSARTTVMAENNKTIMIAGLISSEDTKEVRRLPFLGDIPLLGAPFKRNRTLQTKTEIILFITPHIVSEEQSFVPLQDREQPTLSFEEKEIMEGEKQHILRDRAIQHTIDYLLN